ncbi:MAG: Immunoglobulin I-set domain protein [Pedosphaera sp.]|nr:Immunoglobulin I-set domain protein [Pedosphaera sp.]
MKPINLKSSARLAGALLLGLAAAMTVRADYPSTILSQGPVGYWRLNDSGTVLPQPPAANIGSLGAAGNGTYVEAVRGVVGIPGASGNTAINLPFLVDGNRVRVPYSAQWSPSGSFSVELWEKPAQTNALACAAACVDFTVSTARNGWLLYQGDPTLATGGGWVFRQYGGASATSVTTAAAAVAIDTNAWYHIVGVFNGTTAFLYINGTLAASNTFTGPIHPNANTAIPLTFGARADGSAGYFSSTASFDEPAFYNTALSAARVLAHYQAGSNPLTANYSSVILADSPIGYWRLNEGADVTTPNLGSKGAVANASYIYNAQPGQPGPVSPTYPGFDPANKAPLFDGNSGSVSIPALNVNTNTVTITCWVKPTGSQIADSGIVFSRQGTTTSGLKMANYLGTEIAYDWNNSAETVPTFLNLAAGQWNFVALVVDPAKATVSVHDGSSFQTFTNFNQNLNQAFEGKTLIGQYSGATSNSVFNGSIDEVAIFNRALTLGEVYSEYGAALGNLPPLVLGDPQAPAGTVYVTDPLNLVVVAGGTPSLGYQWRKNTAPILGATNTSYSIGSLVVGDSGSYDCVITNFYGTATSQPASITVTPLSAPIINQNPVGRTNYAGGSIFLNVTTSGGAMHYFWLKNGTNIPGATASAFTITSAVGGDSGNYSVIVSNSIGTATSTTAAVSIIVPSAGSFAAAIVTDAPEAWWRLDEAPGSSVMADAMGRHDGTYNGVTLGVPGAIVTGGTNFAATFPGTGGNQGYADVPYSPALNTDTYSVEAWVKTADGVANQTPVSSESVNSSSPPYQGRGYRFDASSFNDGLWYSAFGLNDQYVSYVVKMGPVHPNQWSHLVMTYSPTTGQVFYNNGVRFPTSGGYANFVRNTTAHFLIGACLPNYGGLEEYWNGQVDEVAVYKTALTQAQVVAHYQAALYGTSTAPVFTLQPKSQVVQVGSTVTFTAKAEGTTPITVQWLKNGSPIVGQTNSTLTLANVYYTNGGSYQLGAANPVGTNSSTAAILTVEPANPAFANLTNGLVLHLKFDGDLVDATGRGNNGTAVGAPTFVAGKIGGSALHYSTAVSAPSGHGGTVTSSNFVTLGVRPDLQFGATTNFSVAYWVRLPAGYVGGDLPFFCNDAGSLGNTGYTFAPGYTNGTWAYSLNGLREGSFTAINDGQWHSLVHTFDRQGIATTYIDGADDDESFIANNQTLDTGLPTNIGQDNTGGYNEAGSADIDDIGVWTRVLSGYEALSIYSVGQTYGKSFDSYGPVTITLNHLANGNIEVIWLGGTLQSAPTLNGPWTAVGGASAPYFQFTPAGAGNVFYRVKL